MQLSPPFHGFKENCTFSNSFLVHIFILACAAILSHNLLLQKGFHFLVNAVCIQSVFLHKLYRRTGLAECIVDANL